MNRAAIYARLSLADEKSTSTERQKKDCRDHAKSLGLEVVDEFTDEGISGYKDVERPEFDRAIEGLVRGDFDTLIVWKLDRLTRRGMGHIGTLLDRLDGSGRRIISKMDGVDTSQSQGRIMVAPRFCRPLAPTPTATLGVATVDWRRRRQCLVLRCRKEPSCDLSTTSDEAPPQRQTERHSLMSMDRRV